MCMVSTPSSGFLGTRWPVYAGNTCVAVKLPKCLPNWTIWSNSSERKYSLLHTLGKTWNYHCSEFWSLNTCIVVTMPPLNLSCAVHSPFPLQNPLAKEKFHIDFVRTNTLPSPDSCSSYRIYHNLFSPGSDRSWQAPIESLQWVFQSLTDSFCLYFSSDIASLRTSNGCQW